MDCTWFFWLALFAIQITSKQTILKGTHNELKCSHRKLINSPVSIDMLVNRRWYIYAKTEDYDEVTCWTSSSIVSFKKAYVNDLEYNTLLRTCDGYPSGAQFDLLAAVNETNGVFVFMPGDRSGNQYHRIDRFLTINGTDMLVMTRCHWEESEFSVMVIGSSVYAEGEIDLDKIVREFQVDYEDVYPLDFYPNIYKTKDI
jgi:hypothetical protein